MNGTRRVRQIIRERDMTERLDRRRFLSRAAAGLSAAGALGMGRPARAAGAAPWGDLLGRFLYDGKAPERARLKVETDVAWCGKFDIRDESLIVRDDGSLANVYLYLRDRDAPISPELEAAVEPRVVLDNRNCIFVPHCMKIWYPKQVFHIVNSEPIAENVAFSPLGDVPANIVLAPGTTADHRFTRRQNAPVPITCNYHPWEIAYVLPRDDPYTDISAADGTFRIARLPVGRWEFQAWHERCGLLDAPGWPRGRFTVNVGPGENDLGTIKIAPALLAGKT
jgi:hypothetical protein